MSYNRRGSRIKRPNYNHSSRYSWRAQTRCDRTPQHFYEDMNIVGQNFVLPSEGSFQIPADRDNLLARLRESDVPSDPDSFEKFVRRLVRVPVADLVIKRVWNLLFGNRTQESTAALYSTQSELLTTNVQNVQGSNSEQTDENSIQNQVPNSNVQYVRPDRDCLKNPTVEKNHNNTHGRHVRYNSGDRLVVCEEGETDRTLSVTLNIQNTENNEPIDSASIESHIANLLQGEGVHNIWQNENDETYVRQVSYNIDDQCSVKLDVAKQVNNESMDVVPSENPIDSTVLDGNEETKFLNISHGFSLQSIKQEPLHSFTFTLNDSQPNQEEKSEYNENLIQNIRCRPIEDLKPNSEQEISNEIPDTQNIFVPNVTSHFIPHNAIEKGLECDDKCSSSNDLQPNSVSQDLTQNLQNDANETSVVIDVKNARNTSSDNGGCNVRRCDVRRSKLSVASETLNSLDHLKSTKGKKRKSTVEDILRNDSEAGETLDNIQKKRRSKSSYTQEVVDELVQSAEPSVTSTRKGKKQKSPSVSDVISRNIEETGSIGDGNVLTKGKNKGSKKQKSESNTSTHELITSETPVQCLDMHDANLEIMKHKLLKTALKKKKIKKSKKPSMKQELKLLRCMMEVLLCKTVDINAADILKNSRKMLDPNRTDKSIKNEYILHNIKNEFKGKVCSTSKEEGSKIKNENTCNEASKNQKSEKTGSFSGKGNVSGALELIQESTGTRDKVKKKSHKHSRSKENLNNSFTGEGVAYGEITYNSLENFTEICNEGSQKKTKREMRDKVKKESHKHSRSKENLNNSFTGEGVTCGEITYNRKAHSLENLTEICNEGLQKKTKREKKKERRKEDFSHVEDFETSKDSVGANIEEVQVVYDKNKGAKVKDHKGKSKKRKKEKSITGETCRKERKDEKVCTVGQRASSVKSPQPEDDNLPKREKFLWKDVILHTIKRTTPHPVPIKKLEILVTHEYLKLRGMISDNTSGKFERYLRKTPGIEVDGDNVKFSNRTVKSASVENPDKISRTENKKVLIKTITTTTKYHVIKDD